MKLFDELLLILVRRRLARFKLHDDASKQFSDGLLSAYATELARRSTLAGSFDKKKFEAEVARTETQLAASVEFEDLKVESVTTFQ
jgi:hypothetical protein